MHVNKRFDYLGMDLELEDAGGVVVSIFKHVDATLDEFPDEVKGKPSTPVANHLFGVREKECNRFAPNRQVLSITQQHSCYSSACARGVTCR